MARQFETKAGALEFIRANMLDGAAPDFCELLGVWTVRLAGGLLA